MRTIACTIICALLGGGALANLPKNPSGKIGRFSPASAVQFTPPAPVAIATRVSDEGTCVRITARGHGFSTQALFRAAAQRAAAWRRANPRATTWWEDCGVLTKDGSVVWSIYYGCGP